MSSFLPSATDSITARSSAHPSHRALFAIIRRLVRASYLIERHPDTNARSDDYAAARRATLSALVTQLTDRGDLELRSDDPRELEEIRLAATGSSMNVAIIPKDQRGRALLLKFTDSAVASSELAASTEVQEQLTADPRLESWSTQVPHVLASGMVDTTTFAIEECLSSRDGRAVAGDRVATDALMSDALAVIGDFHRLTATRRQVDARVLAAIVERPIDIMRAKTSAGLFRCRARALERLASWLRLSLLGLDLEVGWTHGDFHLGNVLIDDLERRVVGIVDWGRAEPDGLTVLDGFTLIAVERAKITGQEFGSYILELLEDVDRPLTDRVHGDALGELQQLLDSDTNIDVRCVLLLTWLKHVANNLKNEDRTRAHALWRLRNVDLVLYGATGIVGS